MGTLARSLLDFCLPRECQACRVPYEPSSGFCRGFCADCEEELRRLEQAARCGLCSMPLTLPGAPCATCLGKGLPYLETVVSLGILTDPLRSAIHRMKYEHRWATAQRLADRLLLRPEVKALIANSDVLVPVPLHHQRQRERGFNQAEVVARRMNGVTKVRVKRAARRIKPTETQTHMQSRAQRIQNLHQAFELVDPESIQGKRIVLVDDVLTTGSTLLSLARTLKSANPESFSAIVLAVADPKGRSFEIT